MKVGQDAASNRTSPTQNDSSQDAKCSTSVDLPEESPLYLAAKRYLLKRAERESEESIADTLNDDRNPPLTPAAGNGFLDIAQRILHDTNQNDEGSYQQAFFTAAKRGHSDVLDLLLETFGLDVNATDGSGFTALHLAASNGCEDVVGTLLATEGIDINKKDKSDFTALDRALEKKRYDVIVLLLAEEGLDWGAGLEDSIQEAARDGHDDLLDSLLAKECASVKDSLDPLSWSVLRGQMEVLRVLLSRHGVKINAVDYRRRTALSWAAQIGRADAVEMLLKHGADANLDDYQLRAPLYWALLGDKEEIIKKLIPVDTGTLLQLVFEGDIDLIETMLCFGPNLDHRDEIGRTALHLAALYRRLDIATTLMDEGADLNIQDHSGRTPLQVALRGRGGGDIARELLKEGAQTMGTMSKDWRQLSEGRDGNVALLCGLLSEEQHLDFPEVADGISDLWKKYPDMHSCLLLLTDEMNRSAWMNGLFKISDKKELTANSLQIDLYDRVDSPPRVSMALWIPVDQMSSESPPKYDGGEVSRIMWSEEYHEELEATVYLSTLPYGCIPDGPADLFHQLLTHAHAQWSELCRKAGDHLSQRRVEQLKSKGKNPETMNDLAKDAQKLAGLRLSLASQISQARNFMKDNREMDYSPAKSRKVVLNCLVEEYESGIKQKLDELDQIARDLLQIEFAWSSIHEARIATNLGQNVMLLTYVSIFYLPLGFCAALWAIPNIADISTRLPFIVTAFCVSLLTLLVTFNMERIAAWSQEGYQYCRSITPSDLVEIISTNLPKKVPRDLLKAPRELLEKISQRKERKKTQDPNHP